MDIWISIGIGLVLLVVGGELLVRGAVASATALGVSPLLIGLTLVGFGTSTPELVTSVTAALNGSAGIAVGNVVGSNIANILFILGVSAIIYPMAVNPRGFRRDAIMLSAAALACMGVVLYGRMSMLLGIGFLVSLVSYVVFVYVQEKRAPDEAATVAEHRAEDAPKGPRQLTLSLAMAVGGIAITIFGARFLVDGSISLAKTLGVSDTIIGLTIVAVGTSMPELVTSVMAALRKHADVAYGNIVGSNIFNVLFILGSTSIIQPIDMPAQIAHFDIWVMLVATGLLVFFARSGATLQRWEGGVLLASYCAYTGYLISIA
ncbi:MAG: calcium/sodium antiporter [Rhodoferax sp.]|uniref:calcium/sodium antiporter n=1 Tax=Rhodoferax sp. TaxID=50421 RepID=UPI002ACD7D8C|nr:calcium/sodium antiporter [Rhodoferax sp.]MDZ7890907.1 calcium/sodium antiporter [Rhodoferax sp.]